MTIRPSLGGIAGYVSINFSAYLGADSTIPMNHRLNAIAMILVSGGVAQEGLAFVPNLRARSPGADYEILDILLVGEQTEKDATIATFEKGFGTC